MFEGKKILITGGAGYLGTELTKRLLNTDVETIRIFSRDELKQTNMQANLDDERLRFLIGDIRDKERLSRAVEDINIVIHAAALKHVPVAEYNPFEAVKTNVNGTQNVIESCLENKVEFALAIGTDKAVSPFNTYGATKLLMERLFIAANYYKGNHKINFSCVRYGNVLGSSGSVVQTFIHQIQKNEKITITESNMTRFNITISQALDLIFRSLENAQGGEVIVPKLKAYKVEDMKNAISEILDANPEVEIINARPGEKYHEVLINKDEIRNTYEDDNDYIVFDKAMQSSLDLTKLNKANLFDEYSSDKVPLLSVNEIKKILIEENLVSKI